MTYSVDLRQRVVAFIEAGGRIVEAARLFGVSRWCIYDWLNRETLKAKPRKQRCFVKLDPQHLEAHVSQYPDAYQHERAKALGVSQYTICKGLKRLALSRKKNDALPGKKRRVSQSLSGNPKPNS